MLSQTINTEITVGITQNTLGRDFALLLIDVYEMISFQGLIQNFMLGRGGSIMVFAIEGLQW